MESKIIKFSIFLIAVSLSVIAVSSVVKLYKKAPKHEQPRPRYEMMTAGDGVVIYAYDKYTGEIWAKVVSQDKWKSLGQVPAHKK